MTDTMNILCAADDNYIPYCGIMLTSLFESNNASEFHVFLLTESLSAESSRDMMRLADSYGQKIQIVVVEPEALKDCPIRKKDHVSIATYYRLLAPILLPDSVDKVLYLDCDIIVDGRIDELWNTDISGDALGCVVDESYLNISYYDRLEINKERKYFNAGVLLLNIGYWRCHDVMKRCFDCISAMSEKLLLHDQDTLNHVLQDEIKFLPVKYNFQTGFLYIDKALGVDVRQEVRDTVSNPIIIHYTGKRKPWLAHYYHPFLTRFRYYKSISLWKDYPLVKKFKEEWRYWRHQIKFALGWKKRPYITDRSICTKDGKQKDIGIY